MFLHADALQLPFRRKRFSTVLSENLLHCVDDTGKLLTGVKDILADGGGMFFTTLVKGDRLADRYLEALAKGGKLISRNMEDHQAVFDRLGMALSCPVRGNTAFIRTAA